jgi:DNA modification methylase
MKIETIKIEKRKISDLIRAEYNPRKITKVQLQDLKEGIEEFGLVSPIVVNELPERYNVIIGGHQRLKILEDLGYTEVDCSIVSLPLDKERKLNIKLNKNGGSFDNDLLKEFFDYEELTEWGFTPDELFDHEEKTADGLIDDDEIPEAKESKVKRGDIWKLGKHRVMCGDSTSSDDVAKLMNGEKADMVFTDPPYGISFEDNAGNKIKNDNLNDEKLIIFNNQWQENAFLVSANNCFLLVWQSPRKFHLLDYIGSWRFFRLITMYKSNRISFPHGAWINKTEPCCVFAKGKPKPTEENYLDDCYVYKHDKESHDDSNVGHPTPKPVKMIIEHITACIKKNQLALDLFGGSGSTLMACEKTNRKCNIMELDEKYCDVIINRWEQFTGLKATIINGTK